MWDISSYAFKHFYNTVKNQVTSSVYWYTITVILIN